MAATSHDHQYKQHLPPSPPPSPPSSRRRPKKKHDPFEELARTPVPSRPASPANEEPDEQESLITRIILTPVLFISFILSLFFVNYRNRAQRTKEHSTTASILSYLAPSSWLDPEPYQDPDNSTWGRNGAAGHVAPHDAIGPRADRQGTDAKQEQKRKSWHLNKKIRKMAKLEISDAFEMRGRIIVGMVAFMVLSSVALWMGARWAFVSLSNALVRAKS